MRAKTISGKRLSREEVKLNAQVVQQLEEARPDHRGECRSGQRPCPFVSCKYHLYLDVNPETGTIKLNFPDLDVWEMPFTCALDLADQGELTLEKIGSIMNLTRERIRQMENTILGKLKEVLEEDGDQDSSRR